MFCMYCDRRFVDVQLKVSQSFVNVRVAAFVTYLCLKCLVNGSYSRKLNDRISFRMFLLLLLFLQHLSKFFSFLAAKEGLLAKDLE